jgi:endonuclease YncB( thermonuclease family)
MKKIAAIIFGIVLGFTVGKAFAIGYGPSKFYGPYNAEVMRVIDGDTIVVMAEIAPNLIAEWSVRLAGIDTPETFRPKCEKERALGKLATQFVKNRFPTNQGNPWVLLRYVKDDKFSGRVVADVHISKSTTLNKLLIDNGHAVEYHGKGPRHDWCA